MFTREREPTTVTPLQPVIGKSEDGETTTVAPSKTGTTDDKNEDGNDNSTQVVDEYLKGFDTMRGGPEVETGKRKRSESDDKEYGTGKCDIDGEKKKPSNRPSFLPFYLSDRCAAVEAAAAAAASSSSSSLLQQGETKIVKKAVIDAYLDSCSEYLLASSAQPPDGVDDFLKRENENERAEADEDFTDYSNYRPTDNSFWRDGEKISLNDGDDGLSTDYRVRCVFKNISKTLKCFSLCRKTVVTKNRALKDVLSMLEYDIRTLDANTVKEKHFLQVISAVKSLLLAVDTTKGSRRSVVNQLHPVTCCLSNDQLKRLCRFTGFGQVNSYGFLECNFNIPVKLIFLGNLDVQQYADSSESGGGGGGGSTVYKIEPCPHFGTHFYECLESIYEICYKKLVKEVRDYIRHKALTDAQHAAAIMELKKRGDMSSLMRLEKTPPPPVYSSSSSSSLSFMAYAAATPHEGSHNSTASFFENLHDLTRRSNIRILGTSGRMNSDSRLRYTRYNGDDHTVTEGDPEEEVDALFASSFIRFRLQQDGGVYMDVYARHAVRLETDNCVMP